MTTPSTPPSPVVTNSTWDDVTKELNKKVKTWPVWLIVVVSVGGVLGFFLLFTIIVCSQRDPKRARYRLSDSQKSRLKPKSRKKTDEPTDTENLIL